MTEYKSEVQKIYAPQERVYARLSNLSILEAIKQNVDNPEARERIMAQTQGKVTEEQMNTIQEKIRNLQIDTDSVSSSTPIGDVTLKIIEREEPKQIKFSIEGLPVQANAWIQLLPASDTECAMRLTVKADLNFFIKQMVGSKLEKGVQEMARMLASIPY